ncbi:uncharacterized protein [Oscarella lobularis]|uniref:uncharacterized protein isoform X2 n=1 Tax=Oscarella lobularis TaxID=121494 RepID=UPI0033143D55
MFGGAYSRKYRDLETERLTTGRSNVSQSYLLARKLSAETNKRRRAMEERRKAREEAENRRREEILAERRKKQREASSLIRIQKIQFGSRKGGPGGGGGGAKGSTRPPSPKVVHFAPTVESHHYYPSATGSIGFSSNGLRVVEGYKVELSNQGSARSALDEALRAIRSGGNSTPSPALARPSSNGIINRSAWMERVGATKEGSAARQKGGSDLSLEDVSSPELEEEEEEEEEEDEKHNPVNISVDSIEDENDSKATINHADKKDEEKKEKVEPLPSKNVAWTVPMSPSLVDIQRRPADADLSDLRKVSSESCIDDRKSAVGVVESPTPRATKVFDRSVVMNAGAAVAVHAALSEYLAGKTVSKVAPTTHQPEPDPGRFTSYVHVPTPQQLGSSSSLTTDEQPKGILKKLSSSSTTSLRTTGSKKSVRFADAEEMSSSKKGVVSSSGKRGCKSEDSGVQRREAVSVASIARKTKGLKGNGAGAVAPAAVTGNRRYADNNINGLAGGLEKTPTDEEINELWGKVRSCLRADEGKSSYRNGDTMAIRRAMTQRPTMRDTSEVTLHYPYDGVRSPRLQQQQQQQQQRQTTQSDKPITALSLEEQQILKSLERINTKLSDKQAALHQATVSITTLRPQFSQSALLVQKRASGALPKTRIRRNPQAIAAAAVAAAAATTGGHQSLLSRTQPSYKQPTYNT